MCVNDEKMHMKEGNPYKLKSLMIRKEMLFNHFCALKKGSVNGF